MIVPWLDNKTERAIGKGFNAKEIHRSKECRSILSALNVAGERSKFSAPVFTLFLLLQSLSTSRFFRPVVPDARCSLRIIKVVANLDWRELRIQSLARCARKLVLAAQETSAGSLIGRDAARDAGNGNRPWAADILKISLKRWKEKHIAPEFISRPFEDNLSSSSAQKHNDGLTKIDGHSEFLEVSMFLHVK